MATNVPFTDPQILYESKELLESFAARTLNPSQLRNDEAIAEIRDGRVATQFVRGVRGLPFYNALTNPTCESSCIAFERHFNPMMKRDSAYFLAVDQVISCVEKHQGKELSQDQQN